MPTDKQRNLILSSMRIANKPITPRDLAKAMMWRGIQTELYLYHLIRNSEQEMIDSGLITRTRVNGQALLELVK